MKHKVFISYAMEDELKAEMLVEELRSRNITVWFDQHNLNPGDRLIPKIKRAIRDADVFLACISPAYSEKYPDSWVKKELRIVIQEEEETGEIKAIPVRIRPDGKVPEELGNRAYSDLSTPKKWEENMQRLVKAIHKFSN